MCRQLPQVEKPKVENRWFKECLNTNEVLVLSYITKNGCETKDVVLFLNIIECLNANEVLVSTRFTKK